MGEVQAELPLLLLLIMLFCALLDVLDEASVHIEFSSVSECWWRMKSSDDISDGTVVLRCIGICREKSWFIAVTKRIFVLFLKVEAGIRKSLGPIYKRWELNREIVWNIRLVCPYRIPGSDPWKWLGGCDRLGQAKPTGA